MSLLIQKIQKEMIKIKRVAIFIDHSNVLHHLINLRKNDLNWPRWYNPLLLAIKLSGNRNLVGVFFYCAPPPSYLLNGTELDKKKYWKQLSYYESIKKLSLVNLKLARTVGIKAKVHEKNLDTQLSVDMPSLAVKNVYDVAILIANDGDYADAVTEVKNLGKKVELACFRKECSMNLRKACDISRRLRISYFETLNFSIKNTLK